ncbi:MAG TPA: DUF5668 domain-containing protein [Thermoanaerobaculia bacterium]|nr:DUF5668 domain-containing protein [Thermoanaerobaculia bacterium]
MEPNTSNRIPFGKLAFGLVLFAVGTLTFTDYIDVIDLRDLWRWWPVFLIFIGVSNEIDSLRARKSDGGYIMVAIGTWLLVANHHFFGLRHSTAFPLGVAIVGLGVIVHALVDAPASARKENGNDPC